LLTANKSENDDGEPNSFQEPVFKSRRNMLKLNQRLENVEREMSTIQING